MRVLLLGAGGMLGHKLLERLPSHGPPGGHEVTGTVRDAVPDPALAARSPRARLLGGVAAEEFGPVRAALDALRPEAVVNCVGIIKQLQAAKDAIPSIRINALLPHLLAEWCAERGARLVHFSTDCVFRGAAGPYAVDSPADAQDLYGRTKHMGEVAGPGCLTIRSSIVGHELKGHVSLVDWFLSRRGQEAKGYARALYTGLPTVVMADLVARALDEWRDLDGVWQATSAAPISKFDLLGLINAEYGLGVRLTRDEEFHCDRRLDGSAFAARTGWVAPDWPEMVRLMHEDYRASGGGYRGQ